MGGLPHPQVHPQLTHSLQMSVFRSIPAAAERKPPRGRDLSLLSWTACGTRRPLSIWWRIGLQADEKYSAGWFRASDSPRPGGNARPSLPAARHRLPPTFLGTAATGMSPKMPREPWRPGPALRSCHQAPRIRGADGDTDSSHENEVRRHAEGEQLLQRNWRACLLSDLVTSFLYLNSTPASPWAQHPGKKPQPSSPPRPSARPDAPRLCIRDASFPNMEAPH